MGKHETITADIDEDLAAVVHAAVEAGDYADVADVVRHALSRWREASRMLDQEGLRAALDASLDSGIGKSADEILIDLRAKYENPPSRAKSSG